MKRLLIVKSDMPIENTENNTSKWIFQYESHQGDVYMCESCCQEVFFLHNIKPDFDFCPYCGKVMKI